MTGEQRSPLPLSAGDVVLLPLGAEHTLLDQVSTQPLALDQLPVIAQETSCPSVVHGGKGATTEIICGEFHVERPYGQPFFSLLPSLLHVRGDQRKVGEWLKTTLSFLTSEASDQQPGTALMLNRLTDILLIQIIRTWMSSTPVSTVGWLAAMRDESIAKALMLLHGAPERSWTVGELAKQVAMSRSSFASRFMTMVGMPPHSYLVRWRMQIAASTLIEENQSMTDVAERVGYSSEAAFSRVFKSHFGVGPGTWRREARKVEQPIAL